MPLSLSSEAKLKRLVSSREDRLSRASGQHSQHQDHDPENGESWHSERSCHVGHLLSILSGPGGFAPSPHSRGQDLKEGKTSKTTP